MTTERTYAMKFIYAIVRKPGEDFARGITTSDLGSPDYKLMLKQHRDYVNTLKSLDITIIPLNPLRNYPDAYFLEDTAVNTQDGIVLTNPGADSRRGEIVDIEPVLAGFDRVLRINAPGTLDGGDVLSTGSHFFIGISRRTNRAGAEQLGRILEDQGNTWTPVPVERCLHLKSSVNYIGNNTLIITREFADRHEFKGYDKIILETAESYAANTLLVNDSLIMPTGFPRTREMLEKTGLDIIELDVSEARKMDGGLTCMSIRL